MRDTDVGMLAWREARIVRYMSWFDAVSSPAHASAGCATSSAKDGIGSDHQNCRRARPPGKPHYRRWTVRAESARSAPADKTRAGGKFEGKRLRENGHELVVVFYLARAEGCPAVLDVVAVAQDAAHIGCDRLGRQYLREARCGMRRRVMIGHLVVDRQLRLVRERVEIFPALAATRLQQLRVILVDH